MLLKHGNSSAPAVQDDTAYEFIMTGFVLALKTKKGREQWKVTIIKGN